MREKILDVTSALRLRLRGGAFLAWPHWQRLVDAAQQRTTRNAAAGRKWRNGYSFLQRAAITGDPRALRWAKAEFVSAALADSGMCDAYLALYLMEASGAASELPLVEAIATSSLRIGEEQQLVGCALEVRYAPLGFIPVSVTTPDDAKLFAASELIKRDRHDLAEIWLEQLDRQTPAALAVKAKLAILNNDLELAQTLLTPVISNSQQLRPDALWAQGVVRMRQGDLEQAILSLLQAVEQAEQQDMRLYARYTLASAYQANGDEQARARELQAIYQEDPGFENVAELLSVGWAQATAEGDDPAWQQLVESFKSGKTAADPLG